MLAERDEIERERRASENQCVISTIDDNKTRDEHSLGCSEGPRGSRTIFIMATDYGIKTQRQQQQQQLLLPFVIVLSEVCNINPLEIKTIIIIIMISKLSVSFRR